MCETDIGSSGKRATRERDEENEEVRKRNQWEEAQEGTRPAVERARGGEDQSEIGSGGRGTIWRRARRMMNQCEGV